MQEVVRQIAKLLPRRTDDDVHSSLSYSGPCLLTHLQPVRHTLHPFLSSRDAAHLLRTSRSTAALLLDYVFVDHTFTFRTVAAFRRSLLFYGRYRMRLSRLCLPDQWDDSLTEGETERPLLPSSLVALSMGNVHDTPSMAHTALDGSSEHWRSVAEMEAEEGKAEEGGSEFYRLIRPVDTERDNESTWDVLRYGESVGIFNQPIPPAALPHGLRALQLSLNFNQPLQHGSIPNTVEMLQFGVDFNQRLDVGVLPASLTHLVFGDCYNQPLLPGALPAGLRRLRLGRQFDRPVPPGVLPPQLQQLSLGHSCSPPIAAGAIPPSVTHLRLGCSSHPLQPGTIPQGIVHLNLAGFSNYTLQSGVLPASVRQLVLSSHHTLSLQPGDLPEGLEVLAFVSTHHLPHTLLPGVVPASVSVVSLSQSYKYGLVAGSIPATVRWLRLPSEYSRRELGRVLSPSTRVVWWPAPIDRSWW